MGNALVRELGANLTKEGFITVPIGATLVYLARIGGRSDKSKAG